MEQKYTEDKENEARRKEAITSFHTMYRKIQKKRNFRLHTHFGIKKEGIIEIWEYAGDQRVRNVCKIKEDDETACYKKAIAELRKYE